jgi:site-specific DNA recombinase
LIFNEEAIPKLIERLTVFQSKKVSANDEQTTIIKARLCEIYKQTNNIIEAIATAGSSQSVFLPKLTELEKQKNEMETQLREIEISKTTVNIDEVMLRKIISQFKQFVKDKNIPECKKFINSFVEKVTVYKDHVEATFKLVASSSFFSENDCMKIQTEEKIKTLFRRFRVA